MIQTKIVRMVMAIAITLFVFRNQLGEMFVAGKDGLAAIYVVMILLISIIPYSIINSAMNKLEDIKNERKKETEFKT